MSKRGREKKREKKITNRITYMVYETYTLRSRKKRISRLCHFRSRFGIGQSAADTSKPDTECVNASFPRK